MTTEVVTVATHTEGLLNELLQNPYGIHVNVLGFGQIWTGFKMKFELVYNHIKDLPDETIIIFIDGFDSTINGSADEAVRRFKEMNCKVLFSQTLDNFYLDKMVFPTCKNNITINTGIYMGYVKYLKVLLAESLTKTCKDDQVIVNKLCKQFDFIDIDTNDYIFKNVYNTRDMKKEIESSNAIFYSQPGTFSFSRIYRGLFEYGQFFIPYLLIIYGIAVYFLYTTQKTYLLAIVTILYMIYFLKIDTSCI